MEMMSTWGHAVGTVDSETEGLGAPSQRLFFHPGTNESFSRYQASEFSFRCGEDVSSY